MTPGVELALEVHDVERDVELGGDPPGVVRSVRGAAALLELGVAVGDIVEAHPDADDLVALPVQDRRRDRRIHASGHRHEDPAHAGTPWPSGSARTAIVPIRIEAMTRGTTSQAVATSSSVVVRPSERRRAPRASSSGIAHRGQDVADLGRAGRAGRPDRARDPFEVEATSRRRAVRVGAHQRQQTRESVGRMAGEFRAGHGEDGRREPVALRVSRATVAGRACAGEVVGGRQTDGARDVLGARPDDGAPASRRAAGPGGAFRASPTAPRHPWDPRTCAHRATRGPPRASGHRVSRYGAAWTASTWSRIPLRAWTISAIRAIGWIGADLVVGEHHGHEDRPVRDRRLQLVRIDPPVAVHRAVRRSRTRTSRGSAACARRRGARPTR